MAQHENNLHKFKQELAQMKYTFFGIKILNLAQYGPGQIIMHYAHVAASLNETPRSITQNDNISMTARKFNPINKVTRLQ